MLSTAHEQSPEMFYKVYLNEPCLMMTPASFQNYKGLILVFTNRTMEKLRSILCWVVSKSSAKRTRALHMMIWGAAASLQHRPLRLLASALLDHTSATALAKTPSPPRPISCSGSWEAGPFRKVLRVAGTNRCRAVAGSNASVATGAGAHRLACHES